MVFTRLLRNLIRDKELGAADRADHPRRGADVRHGPAVQGGRDLRRSSGQRYEPVDSDLVLSYREANDGQVLEEGITEAGSMASAPGRRRRRTPRHGYPMIPFYIFYSMFGFQRTGDQIWALGRRPRPRAS